MSCENVLYRTKCVRTAVLFCENVLDGTKKRLSIPFSPTVSLDIPRILHLLQNICGFQANSLVGYPRPRFGIVLRARLSEKSNIPQRESGIRFRPLHGQNLPILYNLSVNTHHFPDKTYWGFAIVLIFGWQWLNVKSSLIYIS